MPLRETAREEAGTVLIGLGGHRAEAMGLSRGFTYYLLPERWSVVASAALVFQGFYARRSTLLLLLTDGRRAGPGRDRTRRGETREETS